MHRLDWNDIRFFLAIHQAGSLAGAGRDLGVQHSTVGRRLDALEHALGTPLFTRTLDGLLLTEAGRQILPLAEEAAKALAAIELGVGGNARIEGIVRVTTSDAFARFLVNVLPELQARHPNLTVHMLAGNRALDLAKGEADLAVRLMATAQGDLISRTVGLTGWSIYAAPAYLQRRGMLASPTALEGHDVIGFDEAMATTPGGLWLAAHAAGARVVLRANGIVPALNAAAAGMGIAVVPCFIGDAEAGLVRLTREVVGGRPITLVFHPSVGKIPRVRVVIDFIAETVQRSAAAFHGTAPAAPEPVGK